MPKNLLHEYGSVMFNLMPCTISELLCINVGQCLRIITALYLITLTRSRHYSPQLATVLKAEEAPEIPSVPMHHILKRQKGYLYSHTNNGKMADSNSRSVGDRSWHRGGISSTYLCLRHSCDRCITQRSLCDGACDWRGCERRNCDWSSCNCYHQQRSHHHQVVRMADVWLYTPHRPN